MSGLRVHRGVAAGNQGGAALAVAVFSCESHTMAAFDFKGSALIEPPTLGKHETRTVRLIIDSRDRNHDLYPRPDEYDVKFDEQAEDVVSAELVRAHVPTHVAYVVGAANDELIVVVGTVSSVVRVPHGNYEPAALASALAAALPPGLTATYDATTDRYSLVGSGAFSVVCRVEKRGFDGTLSSVYPDHSIGQTLGFPVGIHTSDAGTGVLVAPFRRNFDLNRYAVLHIDGFTANRAMNDVLNKSFAIIENNLSSRLDQCDRPKKTFNPPVAKLTRLHIRWRDYHGNAFDFQNHDHRMELVLTLLKNNLY